MNYSVLTSLILNCTLVISLGITQHGTKSMFQKIVEHENSQNQIIDQQNQRIQALEQELVNLKGK